MTRGLGCRPLNVQYLEPWMERRWRSIYVFMPMFAQWDVSSPYLQAYVVNTTRRSYVDLHNSKS